MPNPTGKNGHGKKIYPPDNVLKASLEEYVRRGFTQKEKIQRLALDHQLSIGTTSLNIIERRLDIPSVRRTPASHEGGRQAVMDEIEKDVTQANGPRFVQEQLRNEGVMVTRDRVREIMLEECPKGFDSRFPGRTKAKIPRKALSAIGPFSEVAADGHEKLGAQALKLGDNVGIPIYTYKDKFTDTVLKADVVRDSRSPGVIGHVYLDFIEKVGGIPIQANFDKGSEVGWEYAIQVALRDVFAPDIDTDVYPGCLLIKSVHNTVIEGFWRWLREKSGGNMKVHLLRGKDEHIFDPNIHFHKDLFYWIFPPLVQKELDKFCTWWNRHQIRPQTEKNMPSGHVPLDALEHPELFGGLDCLIRVPNDVVQDLRDHLTEEVGSREECLRWVSVEFDKLAKDIWESIGSPHITFENSWDIFTEMSDQIEG